VGLNVLYRLTSFYNDVALSTASKNKSMFSIREMDLAIPFFLEGGGEYLPFVISGFPLDVNEICTLLGYYAAYSGNLLPTFRVRSVFAYHR